ncbi:hypothetical protein EJB05_26724, partial [Eragrostis curvula]
MKITVHSSKLVKPVYGSGGAFSIHQGRSRDFEAPVRIKQRGPTIRNMRTVFSNSRRLQKERTPQKDESYIY